MNNVIEAKTERYHQVIVASKKARWVISDVLQNDKFDMNCKFLPDGLSRVDDLEFIDPSMKILISQIQGRTYANLFGLVERFINAKVLEVSQDHLLGDQTALEALIRFSDEELKHQELFRQVDELISKQLPEGYNFNIDPNGVAKVVLSKSTWSVLALTLHIELFTLKHYKESIRDNDNLSEDFKRIFKFHWMEESQHAILDELELRREHEKLSDSEINNSVDDLISLVVAVSEICLAQAKADAAYFLQISPNLYSEEESYRIQKCFEKAYIYQYITSGVPEFAEKLLDILGERRFSKIGTAIQPLMELTK